MHNDQAYAARQELYVVEVDGVQKSEHRIFVESQNAERNSKYAIHAAK